MRFGITIILLVLNVLLFSTLYYLAGKESTDPEFKQAQHLVLDSGLVDSVDRITMSGPALLQPWVIEKSRDKWKLTQPVQWNANLFAVSRILSQLRVLEWETAFTLDEIKASGQSLKDYGLDNPAVTIELANSQSNESMLLRLGATTNIGQRLYILSPDDGSVFVVKRSLIDSVSLSLGELRDTKLFDLMLFDLDGITVEAESKTSLTKDGNEWRFDVPIQAAADPRAVESALAAFNGIQILDFPDTGIGQTGLSNPKYEIQVNGANRRQTLLIGNAITFAEQPCYYARLEDKPTAVIIPQAPVETLLKAQETLRERRFFKLSDMSQISSIELVDSSGTIQLQRLENGQWQCLYQDGEGIKTYDADPTVMEKTLLALQNLRADSFFRDAPSDEDLTSYGLLNPAKRIVIKNGTTESLWLGRTGEEKGLLYARNANARFVYQVRPESLYPVPFDASYYRSRILSNIPAGASIKSVKLVDLRDGTALIDQEFQAGQGVAEYLTGIENARQRKAERAVIETLQSFSVKLYMGPYFDEEQFELHGIELPWQYRMTVEAILPGGGENKITTDTYLITKRLGGTTQYGGYAKTGELFALPLHLVDALEALSPESPMRDLQDVEEETRASLQEEAPVTTQQQSEPVTEPAEDAE